MGSRIANRLVSVINDANRAGAKQYPLEEVTLEAYF